MSPEKESAEALVASLMLLQPKSSEGLLAVLNLYGQRSVEGGAPYDAESSTDEPLSDLIDATWQVQWLNGEWTAWTATNSESGDVITYYEGDVYARPHEEVAE